MGNKTTDWMELIEVMGGKDLHGQVAIVTGTTKGIGKTIVARFVKEGTRLFLVDVDEDTVRKTWMVWAD